MLSHLKVIEFEGLAPSVIAGMYFADQGAELILVARKEIAPVAIDIHNHLLNRNKKCIVLDLKNKQDKAALKEHLKSTDVIIDPFRPGVLEKLGLGPRNLAQINPRINLLRITCYGNYHPFKNQPGHAINFISYSGLLKIFNGKEKIQNNDIEFGLNIFEDFVPPHLGVNAILSHIARGEPYGIQVDCSLAHSCAYFGKIVENVESISLEQPRQMSYEGKLYCLTGLTSKPIEELVKIMGDNSYHKGDQYQISEIKPILDWTINTPNPFSQRQRTNFIRKRGDDNAQYLRKMRPKL